MLYSPYASLEQEIYGKLSPPNDVTNFNMVAQGSKAYLTWTGVTDLDVIHGGTYWIRHTSNTNGVSWAAASDITKTVPGNTNSIYLPLMSGSYLIKALDSTGNESTNAGYIVSNVADILALNAVYTSIQEAQIHPGGLYGPFGSISIDKGINDSNTTNIFYDSSDSTIELASASLSTGTHDAYYATGNHEDDVVSSGTHDDARATGTHNAILNSGSTEYQAVNFVDSAAGNFDDRSGNFDDIEHTANKLEDDNASFDSTWLDNLIRNTTDNTTATVTAVDSSTVLTLSSDIFDASGESYRLETKATQLRDTGASFAAGDVGRTIRNTTNNTTATISTVDSSTVVTLSSGIFSNDNGDAWELEAGPNNLRDTGASFTSALVGRTVRNTNDSTTATVSAFVNSNELTLSSGIFDNKDGHVYEVEPGYDRLYDPTASFTDEYIGKIVRNTTDNTTATVSSRVDGTELVLSSGIFDNQDGEGYRIEVPGGVLRDTGVTFVAGTHDNRIIRNLDSALVSSISSIDAYNNLVLEEDIFGQTDQANYKIEGDVPAEGYYYFTDQSIDLGAVYTSRVTASYSSTAVSVTDLFDLTAGNFDSNSGLFDGTDISDANASLEIRITTDDPAGTPTWGTWTHMLVGDYYARGMQFRMKLTSANTSHNVQVDSLSITVDMPDTTKRQTGVQGDTGTNNGTSIITYSTPFKATPTVGVTLQNADTGDYWTISSSSSTGFTITFFNSSNTATQKTFNWVSTGY
ncbi:MAG: hypothetical protein HOI54_04450 [Candidatus Marinimicrobia bacterium]|jgi:hypothetical protein|nr:hypothetical protein [Candidatus Neomarinimicrobiota bacterium]